MKPIIVSPHAFERIQERKITRIEIETAVRMHDLKEPAKRGRLRVSKRFEHHTLDVFYKETNTALIFVTAYWRK